MPDRQTNDDSAFPVASYDTARRRRLVGLKDEDYQRIATIKPLITQNVDKHVAVFFDYLSKLPEAHELFSKPVILDEAKRAKYDHLLEMVEGQYEDHYIGQRAKLGSLYSRANLELQAFLGAFQILAVSLDADIAGHFKSDAANAAAHIASLRKVSALDLGVIVDVLVAERERTILAQQEAIRELSTPTLQVRDRLLILPIIGMLDSHRAKQLTDGLLQSIRARRAKVVVMDITGVAAVDSKVANHLIQTVAASRLMGATVIVTGLSAEIAQTLVTLGVDLGRIQTVGDLQGGLEEAERVLGYKVVMIAKDAAERSAG